MMIKEGRFEKNVCLVLCKEAEKSKRSGMDWKFSIELCPLYRVDSDLFKMCYFPLQEIA